MSTKGFTLLEFLISLTVVGIILTVGAPAFSHYINNHKIRRVADEIVSGLQLARMEAIKSNTDIIFTPNSTGWSVVAPASGNQPSTTISNRSAEQNEASIIVNSSSANVIFNGRGLTNAANPLTIALTSPNYGDCAANGGEVRCLQINVSRAGQIKLCDPTLPTTDARAC